MTYPVKQMLVHRYTILSQYMDECMPCECTPQGWADWLSEAQPDWRGRDEPAQDGDTFEAFTEEATSHQVFPDDGGFYAIPPMPECWTSATPADVIANVSDARCELLEHGEEETALTERELAELAAKIGPYTFTVYRESGRFTATYRNTQDGPRLELEPKAQGKAN